MTGQCLREDQRFDPVAGSVGEFRILIAVEYARNEQLLADALSDRHEIVCRDGIAEEFDLCVVDESAFAQHREALAARKDDADANLPILLVVRGETPPSVWQYVDDVIEVPIRKAELRGRVAALLRTRRLSVELREQNRRLDEFAGTVSHDLRNPLGVAKGYLELAREDDDPDHFDRAAQTLDRMGTLIDDLLAFARHGTVELDIGTVELQHAVEMAWAHINAGDAKLRIEFDEVDVTADESRLIELFENLLGNAVEHGGEQIEVGRFEDGFYVADDGPGVPENERDEVFETGYTTSDDGTGFGLAIVSDIVDAHGWSIRVTESESGGARFEVRVA